MAEATDPEHGLRNELSAWLQFLETKNHVLAVDPGLLFQLAANSPAGSVPARAADRRNASGLETRPWLRRLNRPSQAPPRMITFSGHSSTPLSCAFSPDGSLVASGSEAPAGGLRIWDAANGRQLISHPLGKSVASCRFLPQGRQVLWSSGRHDPGEPESGILDVDTGACLRRFVPEGATLIPGLMAVSPDGRRVAVRVAPRRKAKEAGRDGASKGLELRVFDVESGRETASLAGHASEIEMCAFSPDGAVLASGSKSELKLWDARKGREIAAAGGFPLFEYPGRPGLKWRAHPMALYFSNSGKILSAVCYDCTLKRSDGRTLRPIDVIPLEVDELQGCFTTFLHAARLERIVAVTDDEIIVLDGVTGKRVGTIEARSHDWRMICAALSPDETRVAAGCGDNNLRVFGCTEAQMTTERPRPSVSAPLAFSPDGRLLLGRGRKGIAVWDAVGGRELMEIDRVKLLGQDLQRKDIAAPSPAADGLGHELIWQLWRRGVFNGVRPGEVRQAVAQAEMGLRREYYGAVDISVEGNVILVWRNDKNEPPVICRLEAQPGESLLGYTDLRKISRDRKRFFVQTSDWRTKASWLRAYDLSTGELLFLCVGPPGFDRWVLSPDDSLAASFGGSGTIFWDLARGSRIISPATEEETHQVSYRDDRCAALGLGGGAIEIWDLALRKKAWTHKGHSRAVTSLVFSPDGKRLVSESWSDASTILVWDTESGREVARLHGQHEWDVHFGGFSSNGRVFMTGQKNGWLKVWDAATGELIARDPGSQPGEWAPSGPVLAAAGEAKEPILFRVENWVKSGIWEPPEPWDPDRDGLPFPRESSPDEPDRDATSGQAPRQIKPGGASHWARLNAPGSSWPSKLFKKSRSGKDGGDQ